MGGPLAQIIEGRYLQGAVIAAGPVKHTVEGVGAIQIHPPSGLAAAPVGEFCMGAALAAEGIGSQGRGIGFGAGGAEESPIQIGIALGFFVIRPDLYNLVVHVHFNKIIHGPLFPGRAVGVRHIRLIEKRIPGLFIHAAAIFQSILFLELLYRFLGLLVIAGGGFVIGKESQIHQPLLHQLHVIPGGAIAQRPLEGPIGAGGGAGRRHGRGAGRGADGNGKEQFQGFYIRFARGFQSVFILKGFNGGGGAIQEIAADGSPVISQLRQLFLHQLHVFPAIAGGQGPIAIPVDNFQGFCIRNARFRQTIGRLHLQHRFLGGIGIGIAGPNLGIIQLPQPGIQFQYRVPFAAHFHDFFFCQRSAGEKEDHHQQQGNQVHPFFHPFISLHQWCTPDCNGLLQENQAVSSGNYPYSSLASCWPIITPMTDAIIRPRVQPLESPRQ